MRENLERIEKEEQEIEKKKAIAKLTKKHLLFQKKYRYHIFRKC